MRQGTEDRREQCGAAREVLARIAELAEPDRVRADTAMITALVKRAVG